MISIDLTKAFSAVDSQFDIEAPIAVQADWLPYPYCEVSEGKFCGSYCYTDPDVEVVGDISFLVRGYCDRCGQPVGKRFVIKFNQIFVSEDDGESYMFKGKQLVLDDALREQIILAMPNSFLCSNYCKGLCPVCGCNLNKERCDCDK